MIITVAIWVVLIYIKPGLFSPSLPAAKTVPLRTLESALFHRKRLTILA